MANHSSDFKIIAQVQLDASNIQAQLNKMSAKISKASGAKLSNDIGLNFQEANMIMRYTNQILGDMVDQVYNLDKAITEFRKVSDLDGGALDRYVSKLAELGQTVGRTGSEMVEAATMFRKNSFNDRDSAQLAKIAAEFQNVSDTAISAADSAGFIISQMKAFGIEAKDAEGIIDRVNEVANNFAVGTNDLSNALELSASGMVTYNNTIEETIGLVTAGTEIMVGRSSQVARGLNTIAANIVANEEELNKYKIAVTNTDGTLRSTFDVLSDLADRWKILDDTTRVALGQTLAGKNQYRVLASVLDNFTDAIKANDTAMQSQGSASRENARYMESLEAKTNQLKATFEDLSNNVINSDLVKSLLDLSNEVLSGLNTNIGQSLIQWMLLSSALTGFGTLVVKVIPHATSSFTALGNVIASVSTGAGSLTESISVFAGGISGLMPVIALVTSAIVVLTLAIKDAYDTSHESLEEINEKIEENSIALEENKDRLKEISEIPRSERAKDIENETIKLKAQNEALERNIELKSKEALKKNVTATTGTEYKYIAGASGGYEIGAGGGEVYTGQAVYATTSDYSTAISGTYGPTPGEYLENLEKIQEVEKQVSVSHEEFVRMWINGDEEFRDKNREVAEDVANHYTNAGEQISDTVKGFIDSVYDSEISFDDALSGIEDALDTLDYSIDLTDQEVANLAEQFPELSAVIDGTSGSFQANIVDLIAQGDAAGYTIEEITGLISSIGGFNAAGIDTSDKVAALDALLQYANAVSAALSAVFGTGGRYSGRTRPVTYSGGSGGGGGGGGKKSSASSEKKTRLNQILNYYKDVADRTLDEIGKKIDEINAKYDEELKALEESNEELENQLELEEKLEDLETARSKKVLVFQNGRFQYSGDIDAISSAQKELNEYNRKQELEAQKKYIEERRKLELADLEDEKKRWEEYKEGLSDVTKAYDIEQGKMLALQKDGTALEKQTWDERLKNLRKFRDEYISISGQISSSGGGGGSYGGGGGSVSTTTGKNKRAATTILPNNSKVAVSVLKNKARAAYNGVDFNALQWLINKGYSTAEARSLWKTVMDWDDFEYYAKGTANAKGGLSIVGEEGPEMRVLNSHDGIIPAEITKNLMEIGSNPEKFISNSNGGYTLNIANIELPGVSNAEQFIYGLKSLAMQRAFKRA